MGFSVCVRRGKHHDQVRPCCFPGCRCPGRTLLWCPPLCPPWCCSCCCSLRFLHRTGPHHPGPGCLHPGLCPLCLWPLCLWQEVCRCRSLLRLWCLWCSLRFFHWTGPHYPGSGPRDSGLCSLLWLWPHWSLLWLIREERRTYIVIYLLGICCYTTDTENYSVPFTLWMGRDKENKEN